MRATRVFLLQPKGSLQKSRLPKHKALFPKPLHLPHSTLRNTKSRIHLGSSLNETNISFKMTDSVQTPRVNATLLDQFVGKTVRIIGKVVQLRGDSATINSSGNVIISLDRNSHLSPNTFVEVVGKVNQDGSIKSHLTTDFGTDIDMNAVEAVVNACHTFKEIFYDPDH